MSASDPRHLNERESAAIKAVFEDIPLTYSPAHLKLQAISQAYRTEIARHLEPFLKQKAGSQAAPVSVADARRDALYIDDMLTNLGLCVMVDGNPALLAAEPANASSRDRSSKSPAQFVILIRSSKAPYYKKAVSSNAVPELSIGPSPDNVHAYLSPLREHAYAYGRSR